MTRHLAIIGGGSWGTALAIVLAPRFHRVRLWVYEEDLAARMQSTRTNDVYLPGFVLPGTVEAGHDLAWALDEAGIVLSVTPSHHTRALYGRMLPHLRPDMLFVSATKGLEGGTLARQTEVIRSVVAAQFEARVGALSGPTFAKEIAAGEPAAIVIASFDEALTRDIQDRFAGPTFRLYRNNDPIGVEMGASVKNVIAIAAGLCAGLGLGSNSLAALVTRGLAEISRLATAAGGQARTLAGLAGLGDLVLTCNGELSRNRQVGFRLGRGETLAGILASMNMVAEGVKTTSAALELARRLGVEMPITAKVQEVFDGRPPREALRDLMERSLKEE